MCTCMLRLAWFTSGSFMLVSCSKVSNVLPVTSPAHKSFEFIYQARVFGEKLQGWRMCSFVFTKCVVSYHVHVLLLAQSHTHTSGAQTAITSDIVPMVFPVGTIRRSALLCLVNESMYIYNYLNLDIICKARFGYTFTVCMGVHVWELSSYVVSAGCLIPLSTLNSWWATAQAFGEHLIRTNAVCWTISSSYPWRRQPGQTDKHLLFLSRSVVVSKCFRPTTLPGRKLTMIDSSKMGCCWHNCPSVRLFLRLLCWCLGRLVVVGRNCSRMEYVDDVLLRWYWMQRKRRRCRWWITPKTGVIIIAKYSLREFCPKACNSIRSHK